MRTPKIIGGLASREEDAAIIIEKTTILESFTQTFILIHEFPSTSDNPDLGFRMEKIMLNNLEPLFKGLKPTTNLDGVWNVLREE